MISFGAGEVMPAAYVISPFHDFFAVFVVSFSTSRR